MFADEAVNDRRPTTAIVEVVARLDDTPPQALCPPLGAVIAADALDRALTATSDVRISFRFHGYCVTASSERITARPVRAGLAETATQSQARN